MLGENHLSLHLKINKINYKSRIHRKVRGTITDAVGLCINARRRPEFRFGRLNGYYRKLNLSDRLTGRGGSVPVGDVARRIAPAGEGYFHF